MGVLSPLTQWSAVIIAGIVATGTMLEMLPIAAVRLGAALALFVQIILELRKGNSWFLTSPLFLLGAISIVFYSLILGIFDIDYKLLPFHLVEGFYGSDAERTIVVFGLWCTAFHSFISVYTSPSSEKGLSRVNRADKHVYLFALIAVTVSLVNVANYVSQQSGGPNFGAIRSISPPVLAFCLVFLVYQAAGALGKNKLLIVAVIVLVIAGQVFIQEAKKPAFMIFAGLLYWLRLNKASIRAILGAGLVSIVIFVSLVQIAQIMRMPKSSALGNKAYTPAVMFGKVLSGKLVLRQTATKYCFQKVLEKHREQPFTATNQFFWLKGLVPRVLWPEKPNLSLGAEYSRDYCGSKVKNAHSASITLLGQPVIHGGLIGLLLHGGILLGCLGGLMWIGRNPYSISAMTVVALLPWLIDFDQDFALYVANAVKFFLIMSPLVFLAVSLGQRPQPT